MRLLSLNIEEKLREVLVFIQAVDSSSAARTTIRWRLQALCVTSRALLST